MVWEGEHRNRETTEVIPECEAVGVIGEVVGETLAPAATTTATARATAAPAAGSQPIGSTVVLPWGLQRRGETVGGCVGGKHFYLRDNVPAAKERNGEGGKGDEYACGLYGYYCPGGGTVCAAAAPGRVEWAVRPFFSVQPWLLGIDRTEVQ